MNKLIIIIIFFSSIFSYSQNKTSLTVRNNYDASLLDNVLVTIYDLDENVVYFTKSNSYGTIYFSEIFKKNYKIVFNKNGFEKFILNNIEDNKDIFLIPVIQIPVYLEEVNIIGKRNFIHTAKDTLTYVSDNLRNKNTSTIEDLIGNIPGVTIDKLNGRISYHNKGISTILVDGENIVENNYQIISSNLSEKLAKSVQIIEGYSSNKLLKKFNKSNNIAINIKLDEAYKDNIKGNVKLGVGHKSTYDSSLNLFLFSKKMKTINNFQYNNIGNYSLGNTTSNNEFNNEDVVIIKNEELDKIKVKPAIEKYLRIDLNNTNNLIQNNDASFTSNVLIKLNNSADLKLNSIIYNDEFNFLKEEIIKPTDSNLSTLNNNFSTKKKLDNFYINLSLRYSLDENQEIYLNNNFKHKSNNLFNNVQQNNNSIILNSAYKLPEYSFGLQYLNRFNAKNAIILFNTVKYSSLTENNKLNSNVEIFEPTLNDNFSAIFQNIDGQTLKLDYGLNYLYKINPNNIFTVGLLYSKFDNKNRLFNNYVNFSSLNAVNLTETNQIFKDFSTQIHYSFFSKKNKLISALKLKYLNYEFNTQISQKIYFLPSVNYNFKNYNFDYNLSFHRDLSFDNILFRNNFQLLKNFNEFYQNSLTNSPSFGINQVNISSTYNFIKSQSELYYNINYSFGNKHFIEKMDFNDNFFTTTIVPFKNSQQNFNLKIGFEKYLDRINHYVKLIPEYKLSKWDNIIENNYFKNNNNDYQIKTTIRSSFENTFNYHAGFIFNNLIFNQSNTDVILKNTNKINTYNVFFNFLINCCKDEVKIQFKNEFIKYNESHPFYYASLNSIYKPKNSNLELELDFRNIFNYKNYFNKYQSQNFLYESKVVLIPSVVLLKANYIF